YMAEESERHARLLAKVTRASCKRYTRAGRRDGSQVVCDAVILRSAPRTAPSGCTTFVASPLRWQKVDNDDRRRAWNREFRGGDGRGKGPDRRGLRSQPRGAHGVTPGRRLDRRD